MGEYKRNGFTGWKKEQENAFTPMKATGAAAHLMGAAHTADSTTWLNVPYERKDEAKAMGARWNPGQKQWYLPVGVDPIPLIRAGFMRG